MELLKTITELEFTAIKGIITVPDKYELYKKVTIDDQIIGWQAEIDKYEKEAEPKDAELIELGKSIHSYYQNQFRKEELIIRIKEYSEKIIDKLIVK